MNLVKINLIKVTLIAVGLMLAGCPADSPTTTGTITVIAEPGDVVSIGSSGTNFKTVNATGEAVFTGLAAGGVDIHIFSADGYSATSYYGVNSGTVSAGSGQSVIDVSVTVLNADVYGQTYYLQDGSQYYQGTFNNTTGLVSFDVDTLAGTLISATIYAGQGFAISSAGNSISGSAEMLNLGTLELTTRAISGSAQANLTANFSAVPPTPPTLVTLASVIPPVGFNVKDARFADVLLSNSNLGSLTLPDGIESAAISDNTWTIFASDGIKSWNKSGTFTSGETLSISATLVAAPTIAANQAGATIDWVNQAGEWTTNLLIISDFSKDWAIFTGSNVSSITLPTVPVGVVSPLGAGLQYFLVMGNFNVSGVTYEELFSLSPNTSPPNTESLFGAAVVYTR